MIRLVAKANAILLVQYAAGSLIPLLLVPHIVRSIGIEQFGQLAVALAWAGYGSLVAQYAFPLTGPQRLAGSPAAAGPTVLAETTATKFLLLLLVLPAMAALALFQGTGGSIGIAALVVSVLVPTGTAMNSAWFLQAQGRFSWVCIASIIGACTALGLGWFQVTGSDAGSVVGAAIALSFGTLFVGAATLVSAFRLAGPGPRVRVARARPFELMRQDLPLFASQMISALYTLSGPIVIDQLAGAAAAGRYGAIERIVNALVAACLLTHVAAYPRLAQLYVSDRPRYWTLLKIVIASYLAVAGTLAAGLWLFRVQVTGFVLGANGADAHALLAWGLAWLVVGIFGSALTGYLAVSDRRQRVMPLTMQVLAACVLVGVPAVAVFGPAGWMAALVCSQSIVVFKARREWMDRDAP